MRICSNEDIEDLFERGQFECRDGEGAKLSLDREDPYRLGLRIDRIVQVTGVVDVASETGHTCEEIELDTTLNPGNLYLAVTRERFRLGSETVATIHTRSRYARLGLEVLGSSNVVVPGFGETGLAPLILEIRVSLPTRGISRDVAYAFLMVYRFSGLSTYRNTRDYLDRFPFSYMEMK